MKKAALKLYNTGSQECLEHLKFYAQHILSTGKMLDHVCPLVL
jgi:hypothetical protein